MSRSHHAGWMALLFFLTLSVTAAFCQAPLPGPLTDPSGNRPAEPRLVRMHVGSATLQVEIALTPETQARGLMFRDTLPRDQGMLFVYDYPQHLTFWMKNTTVPLDIAFISAENRIEEILAMTPLSEKIYRSRKPALFALEVNRGWFRKNGVKVGDRIRF